MGVLFRLPISSLIGFFCVSFCSCAHKQVKLESYKLERYVGADNQADLEIYEFARKILITEFSVTDKKLPYVLEELTEASIRGGNVGMSTVLLDYLHLKSRVVSLKVTDSNFLQVLDAICVIAGSDVYWSISGKVLIIGSDRISFMKEVNGQVDRNGTESSAPF